MSPLGTITKGLVGSVEKLEIRGRAETIQTTAWQDWLEYWEEPRRPEETCCHLDSSERPSTNTCEKNSQGIITIINE